MTGLLIRPPKGALRHLKAFRNVRLAPPPKLVLLVCVLWASWVLQLRKSLPSHMAFRHHLFSLPSSLCLTGTLSTTSLKRLPPYIRLCGDTCFIQYNFYFSSAVIAIVSLAQWFCVSMCVNGKRVCVCLLVKDDSTIFCKKADRRVAVAIATEQPCFVSSLFSR